MRGLPGVGADADHLEAGAEIAQVVLDQAEIGLIAGRDDQVPCRGLSSDWDRPSATLRLRMPSRCLGGGDYGALRFWALIEGYRSRSSDVDYAPETPDGGLRFTDWVPRG